MSQARNYSLAHISQFLGKDLRGAIPPVNNTLQYLDAAGIRAIRCIKLIAAGHVAKRSTIYHHPYIFYSLDKHSPTNSA